MAWVLNLSSNPPNIYNDEGTEEIHNALDQPFPAALWYIDEDGQNITNSGFVEAHNALDKPFPSIFWFITDDRQDITHAGFVELPAYFQNIYFGDIDTFGMYLGTKVVYSAYLGSQRIY